MGKQRQSTTIRQEPTLSPQQMMLVRILPVPAENMASVIDRELEENPLLEKETEADPLPEDPIDSPDRYRKNTREEGSTYPPIADQPSLQDYLHQQLGTLDWESAREKRIAEHLLGSIGESGRLNRDLWAIQDDLYLKEYIEVSIEEIESALKKVQSLEPSGIAARDLRECLQIQLRQLLEGDAPPSSPADLEDLSRALQIVEQQFEPYARRQFDKVQEALGISREALQRADEKIQQLNPKPASGYSMGPGPGTDYVLPDFTVHNQGGQLEVILHNEQTPRLRVSDRYRALLDQLRSGGSLNSKQQEQYDYLRQKFESAKWFIDAIRQRQQTLRKTMQAIVDYQREYFLSGDVRDLRPMIQKDIAERTGLDISTISRVVNSKYVQTDFGTKLLKEFFSEAITTESGKEVSNLEVKERLRQLVEEEDKQDPLTDEQLTEKLEESGYRIARRTVNKYRKQMGIPAARLRRAL